MDTYSSHQSYFTTIINKIKMFCSELEKEQDIIDNLDNMGFTHVPKFALKAYKRKLDSQALSLVGDNDAYYRNRLLSWSITDKIQK